MRAGPSVLWTLYRLAARLICLAAGHRWIECKPIRLPVLWSPLHVWSSFHLCGRCRVLHSGPSVLSVRQPEELPF